MSDRQDTETHRWVHDGRKCKMLTTGGHWCGYVQTPLPVSQDRVSEVTDTGVHQLIDVHGGITYGPDDEGWIGFDTAHSRDYNITDGGDELREGDYLYDVDDEKTNVWGADEVREEVNRLADQLTLLEGFITEVCNDVEY